MTRRILLSGAMGLIGRRLTAAREAEGDTVVPLVRRPGPEPAVLWDPTADTLDPAAVSGFDAVVHLAGEPVASGLWTDAKKAKIRDSRVQSTSVLASALARAERPPSTFVCASGINFYGDAGDRIVTESSPRGEGFLADVCVAWEAAAAPLEGVARVVHTRIGMVLAEDGGALATMLPVFRLGLGGPIGGGTAYVSWITIGDAVRALGRAIESDGLAGPVNLVAPEPVTNAEFTRALGAALNRPAIIPVPGFALRLTLGQLATETVLNSVRAVPERLKADGFRFEQERIEPALRSVLGS